MKIRAPKAILRSLFDAAIDAAGAVRLKDHLPTPPAGRLIVVGAGKAAAAMAAFVEDAYDRPVSGLVVTRYGHSVPTRRIRVIEAGHPMPDTAGALAAREILESVRNLTRDDLVLALMSGGGSALLTLPGPGLSFADLATTNAQLLASGAPIGEINTVRKHLSLISGGRLGLAAAPAEIVTLAISDVPRDDISAIASGPAVPDPTTLADARSIVSSRGLVLPDTVLRHLEDPDNETPKRLDHARSFIIARPRDALEAAARQAVSLGLDPIILSDRVEGEAAEVGRAHAALARRLGPGQVLLSGGEVTVTGATHGSGGPNREYALALGIALGGAPDISALAADTDGIDGSSDGAGAFVLHDMMHRAAELGLDPVHELQEHRSGNFFSSIGDDLVTGPTRTNVNDFRAILAA